MKMTTTMIKRIGDRFRAVTQKVNDIVEYNLLYHRKLQETSVDFEQIVSGLKTLADLASSTSMEISTVIDALLEAGEITEELARELSGGTMLLVNFLSIFARHDPDTIAEFLMVTDVPAREAALLLLPKDVVQSWQKSIQKTLDIS